MGCRLLAAAMLIVGCRAAKLAALGEAESLKPEARGAGGPTLVVLGLDGVGRDLLYELLQGGHLPGLSALLYGDGLAHAHLDHTLLSVLPSATIPAWASMWTGAIPAEHGVTGNEIWIRERAEFATPAPVMVGQLDPVIDLYTEGYADGLLEVPSVWQRLRARDARVRIWVSLTQFHEGADRLLLLDEAAMGDATTAILKTAVVGGQRQIWAQIDEEALDEVVDEIARDGVPDVLGIYLPGIDQYAHVAARGPDRARREYLMEVVDPKLARLATALSGHDAWVVVVSDHGHTEVLADDAHALDVEPVEVLRRAGFRVRPFERRAEGDFDAVLGYQGFMAYVYLRDRRVRDWGRPPRFREDVLAAAEAFRRANEGRPGTPMHATLELILTRRPRPVAERDLPFQVYDHGRLVPVEAWLRRHPHPEWIQVPERLRDLAVGRHGERAGDLLLVARVEDPLPNRWYFAPRYHSEHGSATRRDSEVPLVVAHPRRSTAEIAGLVKDVLGARPRQSDVAELILRLRAAP